MVVEDYVAKIAFFDFPSRCFLFFVFLRQAFVAFLLKAVRLKQNITQQRLAEDSGVSQIVMPFFE